MPPKKAAPVVLTPEEIKAQKILAFKDKAAKAIGKGEFLDAVEIFTEAMKEDSKDATLYLNRSAAYSMAGKYKPAQEDADEAIRLAPNNAKGYFRRGHALENLLLLPEAVESYKKAVELDGENVAYQNSLKEISQILDELKLDDGKVSDNPESDKFVNLVKWLRDGGARFPKLYMKYYSDDYRGVHCLAKVRNNDTVLYVPLKYIMTSEVARGSIIGRRIVESRIELRSKHSYLAAYLLQERELGVKSFWNPYIRILPERYANMPIFFPEDELAWLTGSFTLYKIGDRIDSLRREYDNIRRAVPEFNRYSYEDFVWARLVVITRIFGLQIEATKTDGLVPYADMLNHKLPRETKWSFEDTVRGFVITSLQTIQRGEQIYDSYGRKSNNRFFVNYGFSLDENEDNEAMIRLELPRNAPSFNFKLSCLGGNPMTARREYQIPATYRDQKTKELFGFMRLVHAKDSELLPLTQSTKDGNVNPETVEPISIANEKACLKAIAAACQASLDNFPTTLQEDEDLMKSGKLVMFSNERNCVVQRLGEKRVLQWFIDLAKRVTPLLDLPWKEVKRIATSASSSTAPADFYIAVVVAQLVKNGK